MSTYKGNVGHLLQHWTLCELLVIAHQQDTPGLSFIDAHAMGPLARENQNPDNPDQFLRVLGRLSNCRESAYERAWHHLAPNGGYPNSAAFVEQIWEREFSMLLCEINPSTAGELRPWCEHVGKLQMCKNARLFEDDWRKRFEEGLPNPSEMGLADGSLTLVSFDPYMYNKRREVRRPNPGILYPEDIERVMSAMGSLEGGILIQLSTYSTNDGNSQESVISSVNSILAAHGYKLLAVVRVDGRMMSLVYTRKVSWSHELATLANRFTEWLSAA